MRSLIFGVGWSAIVYYAVGLTPEWSRFLYFVFVSVLFNQVRLCHLPLLALILSPVVLIKLPLSRHCHVGMMQL